MIKPFVVSAPGKLVLSGEYAVLEGAPAIAAAVDVRAEVRVEPADQFALQVVNTGERFGFDLDGSGLLQWQQDPGEFAGLLETAFIVLTDNLDVIDPFVCSIDTRDFFADTENGERTKIGVGSSAAVAVCLTAAFQLIVGQAPAMTRAMEVHADFQNQQGSG
ncbi:MAG: hypothetical protein ACR2QG_11420, partial [Gammaproteobacteria bacterium]